MTSSVHLQGNLKDLSKHNKDQFSYQLTRKATKELEQAMDSKITMIEQHVASLKTDTAHLQSEVATKLQPLIDSVVRVHEDNYPTASRFWRDGFDGTDLAGNLLQWNIHLEDPQGAEKGR